MAGEKQHHPHPPNYKDPFTAGQMVGMLVMIDFIEENPSIPIEVLRKLKTVSADNVQGYFEKPTEDIFLMINNIVKEIKL